MLLRHYNIGTFRLYNIYSPSRPSHAKSPFQIPVLLLFLPRQFLPGVPLVFLFHRFHNIVVLGRIALRLCYFFDTGFHTLWHRKFHAVIIAITVFILCYRRRRSSWYIFLFCCIWLVLLHSCCFIQYITLCFLTEVYIFIQSYGSIFVLLCPLLLYFRKYIIKTVKESSTWRAKRYGKNYLHGR